MRWVLVSYAGDHDLLDALCSGWGWSVCPAQGCCMASSCCFEGGLGLNMGVKMGRVWSVSTRTAVSCTNHTKA